MPKIAISDDPRTREWRAIDYDAHGYALIVGGRVTASGRLDPICYQLDATARERIARLYGLQEAGEFCRARAEWESAAHCST